MIYNNASGDTALAPIDIDLAQLEGNMSVPLVLTVTESLSAAWPKFRNGKPFAQFVLSLPLGVATFTALADDPSLSRTLQSTGPVAQSDAYDYRSLGHAKLAREKARHFSGFNREARIRRALHALTTMPRTINLSPEDARWIAEDADLQDI